MSSLNGSIPLPSGLELRFARPSDDQFLLQMFMAARPWLSATSDDQDFVRFMFEDQRRINNLGNGSVYPEHLDFVIERGGQAVGHLVIDLGYGDWHIAQFEVHPLARDKGIGSDVVRGLQSGVSKGGLALTAHTLDSLVRALAFYRRLGFQVTAAQPPMVALTWYPAGHPARIQMPGVS